MGKTIIDYDVICWACTMRSCIYGTGGQVAVVITVSTELQFICLFFFH